jgi:hypothetical protein
MVIMKSVYTMMLTAGSTYCWEEYFQGMLILERKRSNQSGLLYMHISLDMGVFLKGNQSDKNNVVEKLVLMLDGSPGELVVKEWYIHNSIIGIICQNTPSHKHD